MSKRMVGTGLGLVLLTFAAPALATDNQVSAYVRPPTCERPWFKVGLINEVPRPNLFQVEKPDGIHDYYVHPDTTERLTFGPGPAEGGKTVGVWGPSYSFHVEATAPDLRGCP